MGRPLTSERLSQLRARVPQAAPGGLQSDSRRLGDLLEGEAAVGEHHEHATLFQRQSLDSGDDRLRELNVGATYALGPGITTYGGLIFKKDSDGTAGVPGTSGVVFLLGTQLLF